MFSEKNFVFLQRQTIQKTMSKEKNSCIASEPSAGLTYGMSPELRNSDLLWRISNLEHQDKICLVQYIRHEMEYEAEEDKAWDKLEIGPQSMEEAKMRLDEAEAEFDRGEYSTEEEVRAELRAEFPWLP